MKFREKLGRMHKEWSSVQPFTFRKENAEGLEPMNTAIDILGQYQRYCEVIREGAQKQSKKQLADNMFRYYTILGRYIQALDQIDAEIHKGAEQVGLEGGEE